MICLARPPVLPMASVWTAVHDNSSVVSHIGLALTPSMLHCLWLECAAAAGGFQC